MVATMTTNLVGFVTGKATLDPKTISAEDWVEIIYAMANELPLGYLRKLESAR